MKAISVQGTEPNLLVKAVDSNIACIAIYICNRGGTTATFDIYIVPAGSSPGDDETFFIVNQTLEPYDTFILNMEKFLLEPGDAIYIKKYDETSKISVQASYAKF